MFATPGEGHNGVVRSRPARTRRASRALMVALAMIITATGCNRLNPQAAPSASDTAAPPSASATAEAPSPSPIVATLGPLTGAWKGTWTNTSPITASGTFVLTWAQQDNQLFGAIGVTGSNCITAGNVTGNLDGSKIKFGAVEGATSIEYEGIVSGTIMTGTYETDCGDAKGTWTAVKA